MKRFLLILLVVVACKNPELKEEENFPTPFEKSNGNQTPEYREIIDFYIELAREFPEINIQTMGPTDSGNPLHIVTFNEDGAFNFAKLRERNAIILINNGIHPGESDGIDATMQLFRDLAIQKIKSPRRTVIVTIPVYNIGGALYRNRHTRANQNGPEEYGFRGNARNYDLNRDFMKSDTQNAFSFAEIFHLIQPDFFIDNHVSNGADYQYTLTHLFTQHNKLGGKMGRYLNNDLIPELSDSLAAKNWDITPYVNVYNQVPDSGFSQFMDHARYSTGYTALWNTFGMMVETHMLKPYKKRVKGTYELMKSMITITEKNRDTIKKLKEEAVRASMASSFYLTGWKIDSTKVSNLNFKGYEADTITSEVTGYPRLSYDQTRPFTKEIPYYNHFSAGKRITVPESYIVPAGWYEVRKRMEANAVEFTEVSKDTTVLAEVYYIESYKTFPYAYEGHYSHYNTQVTTVQDSVVLSKGDIVIPTAQPAIRYIMEALEPETTDSFFNWNFFDTVLQQKEGYSSYVFEDTAAQMLAKDSLLRKDFELKKTEDPVFAENPRAQLQWLFKKSVHYEKKHNRYPIYRIPKKKL